MDNNQSRTQSDRVPRLPKKAILRRIELQFVELHRKHRGPLLVVIPGKEHWLWLWQRSRRRIHPVYFLVHINTWEELEYRMRNGRTDGK
jgi:hypothetical protein